MQKSFIAKCLGLFLEWLCLISLYCYSVIYYILVPIQNPIQHTVRCNPIRMRILHQKHLKQKLLCKFEVCVCVNMLALIFTWMNISDSTRQAVTVSIWCYHTDTVCLSASKSVNCTGSVVHALTAGELAITVLKYSRVRVCSCALLPEHRQVVPLAAHISSHMIRHTGH